MSDFKVPQGWQVEYLKDLSTDGIKNGVFNDPQKVGEGAKLINVVNLYSGAHINTEKLTRLNLTKKEIAKYKVEVGDVFFTRSSLVLNGIAQCNINLDDSDDIVFDGHVMRVRPNSKKVVPFYLKEFCLSDSAKKFFMRHAKTTTMTTIGQGEVGNLPVLLPPKQEQEKIVVILSSWDKAIQLKENLIEQKIKQKKGLMQKLLTGETRLDGFKEPWKKVKLGSIATIIMGQSPKSDSYNDLKEGIPLIQGNADIKNRRTLPRMWTTNPTKICHPEDILMTVRAPVGSIALSEHEACLGRGVCAIKANINSEYLYYQLIRRENMWGNIAQGSTFESINSNDIKDLIIEVPTEKEQIAIAKVLKVADKYLSLLKRELEELNSQKQALMQQLLTGKIRVKV